MFYDLVWIDHIGYLLPFDDPLTNMKLAMVPLIPVMIPQTNMQTASLPLTTMKISLTNLNLAKVPLPPMMTPLQTWGQHGCHSPL